MVGLFGGLSASSSPGRVIRLLAISVIVTPRGADINTDKLLNEIAKKGFVGALADWSGPDLRLSDALTGLGQGRHAILQVLEQRQCTLPAEAVRGCSCFEIFNMAELWLKRARVDEEEYKQRFKRAVKFYHPDKMGGSETHMLHLRSCSGLLRDPTLVKVRKEYIAELRKVLETCRKHAVRRKMTLGECYRTEVEMLHECETGICLSSPRRIGAAEGDFRTVDGDRAEYSEKGIIERLVVLLDDSFSMEGWKLEAAKQALAGIMPRIERTPTDVHFIRSKEGPEGFHSTQVYEHNSTGFTYDEIAQHWRTCCTTYLWEYTYGVVSKIVSPLVEVILITDGDDNDSGGAFGGAEGFSHMMKLFLAIGKQPRFRVYCIGDDSVLACKGKTNHYRDLALATGGTFVAVESGMNETARRTGLDAFAEECNAPFADRRERAKDAQNRYQTLLIEGSAKKYDWAENLRPRDGSASGDDAEMLNSGDDNDSEEAKGARKTREL